MKDKLDKQYNNLQEWRKGILSIFLAMLGGEGVMLYALVSGEKPNNVWILFGFGIIAIVAMAWYIAKLNEQIDDVIDSIGEPK